MKITRKWALEYLSVIRVRRGPVTLLLWFYKEGDLESTAFLFPTTRIFSAAEKPPVEGIYYVQGFMNEDRYQPKYYKDGSWYNLDDCESYSHTMRPWFGLLSDHTKEINKLIGVA